MIPFFFKPGRAIPAKTRNFLPVLFGTGEGVGQPLRSLGPEALSALDYQGVLPLLYWQVVRNGWERHLPPGILEKIRPSYILAASLTAHEDREIRQALQCLENAGLSAILLKGADLRGRVYGDPAVRPMVDFDLLVSEANVSIVTALLGEKGYMPSPDPLPGFRARFRQVCVLKQPPGKFLPLDLHCGEIRAFQGFYRLSYESLAEKAVVRESGGGSVKVLSPEHTLIHLCLHICHDSRFHVKVLQFIDLSLTLRRLSFDWPVFLQEVDRCSCQAPVYLVLKYLTELDPGIVPVWALDLLAQYSPSWMEKLILSPFGFLPLSLLPFYHHRRLEDWAFYIRAKVWPQDSYRLGIYGDYAAYMRKVLRKRKLDHP